MTSDQKRCLTRLIVLVGEPYSVADMGHGLRVSWDFGSVLLPRHGGEVCDLQLNDSLAALAVLGRHWPDTRIAGSA